MTSSFFPNLKATAVATSTVAAVMAAAVLAAPAEAAGSSYSIPTPASPDFLLSPVFLWVAANVIIVWLVSSSRRRAGRGQAAANDDTGEVAVVPGAVDGFYASSEYEAFSDAPPVSKRTQAREARAGRRSDRPPRVRQKPGGGAAAPATVVAEARDEAAQPRDERRRRRLGQTQAQDLELEETAATDVPVVPASGDDDDGDGDVSMESLWASIVQRRAARPAVVRKSESWSNEEMPRLQRVAETADARRRQVRKSVSAVAKAAAEAAGEAEAAAPATATAAASGWQQVGWRTRDVLVSISPDELLRRAESFIRRQREHLQLQRQESEQRQLLQLQRGGGGVHGHGAPAAPAPLIRV